MLQRLHVPQWACKHDIFKLPRAPYSEIFYLLIERIYQYCEHTVLVSHYNVRKNPITNHSNLLGLVSPEMLQNLISNRRFLTVMPDHWQSQFLLHFGGFSEIRCVVLAAYRV